MKIRSIFLYLLIIGGLSGCVKNNFNYPEGTVGSSKIIYFPSISTIGNKFVILYLGDSFTDSGATAVLNGATATYTTTGSVDLTKGGVYNLVYTAANPQGYTASDFRTVVVIDGAGVSANNFSGTYNRLDGPLPDGTPTGVTSTWTRTANGIYTVENPGGAGVGAGLTVVVVNYSGTNIAIPQQVSPDFGTASSIGATYKPGASPSYTWAFIAGGYGSQVRYFSK